VAWDSERIERLLAAAGEQCWPLSDVWLGLSVEHPVHARAGDHDAARRRHRLDLAARDHVQHRLPVAAEHPGCGGDSHASAGTVGGGSLRGSSIWLTLASGSFGTRWQKVTKKRIC
jgi:hypothetical protein